tara:strand:+ start:1439 stop:3802 length:2364 start_codon:yes stop_codon:yes gene_type:complete
MNLLQFVKNLPDNLVYAPIYRQGEKMLSGKEATGKNPLEEAFHRKFKPSDVVLALERNKKLGAVGLFTGIRGNGIVILDCDRNLSALKKKWGDMKDVPVITSTKKNAAKYIFRVPENLWGEVQGHGLSEATGGCYEILWGRQGLIYGEYPGGKVSEKGTYGFKGDIENIPVAPDWLLSEMKASKAGDGSGFLKNRKGLDLSDRTEDEIAQIIQECLSVITHQGTGSREHWIKIGMAIHSELPDESGLTLWSAWSSEDPEYADEWQNSNPCSSPWKSFRPGKVALGTLIWLADQEDPKRARFSVVSKDIIERAEAKQVQEIRTSTLPFDEVIKQAKYILELDNPAEMNYRLNTLALQSGYRDQVALEKLIVDQIQYEGAAKLMQVEELMKIEGKRDYLIPDVLPTPSVVLVYGAGGDGKSMSAWALAKHIATGAPFIVRGKPVPVKQGPVLLLNGDQPLIQLKEQLEEVDFPINKFTHIQTDWSLQRYAQFVSLMKKIKPSLVVIDSLIGCSGGRAFDENKSDFATPLYWLTRNNGVLFPATTILLIHHANKTGGFRGTSAIRDAVDETWALKKPSNEMLEKIGSHSRLITVEKSRSGRSGTSLIMRMESDLSFTISDFTPEIDPTETSPIGIIDRVLQRLRVVHPESRTRTELNADPLIGGKVAVIRKSLQRLEKRGLISVTSEKGVNSYKAILARGDFAYAVPTLDKSSDTKDSGGGTEVGQPDNSSVAVPPGTTLEKEVSCPTPKASAETEKGAIGTADTYPRAREDRTRSELDKAREEAWAKWF